MTNEIPRDGALIRKVLNTRVVMYVELFTKLLYTLSLHVPQHSTAQPLTSRHADPLCAPQLVFLSLPLASQHIGV